MDKNFTKHYQILKEELQMATSEFYMPTVNLFGVNKVQEVGSRV